MTWLAGLIGRYFLRDDATPGSRDPGVDLDLDHFSASLYWIKHKAGKPLKDFSVATISIYVREELIRQCGLLAGGSVTVPINNPESGKNSQNMRMCLPVILCTRFLPYNSCVMFLLMACLTSTSEHSAMCSFLTSFQRYLSPSNAIHLPLSRDSLDCVLLYL